MVWNHCHSYIIRLNFNALNRSLSSRALSTYWTERIVKERICVLQNDDPYNLAKGESLLWSIVTLDNLIAHKFMPEKEKFFMERKIVEDKCFCLFLSPVKNTCLTFERQCKQTKKVAIYLSRQDSINSLPSLEKVWLKFQLILSINKKLEITSKS